MAWDDEPVEAIDGINGDLITLDQAEQEEEPFCLLPTPSLAHRVSLSISSYELKLTTMKITGQEYSPRLRPASAFHQSP